MSKFGGQWVKPEGFLNKIFVPDGADYDPTKPDQFETVCSDLVFPDGFREGKNIEWAPWQLDTIVRPLLGLRWKSSGLRVIRTCLFVAGRGNAKTTLLSAVGVFGLIDPDERNPEVDLLSLSRETAERMFRVISSLIRGNEDLDALLNVAVRGRRVNKVEGGGELVVRSGDADAEMGLNPSLALIDELSSLRTRDIHDAVKSAFGKRPEGALVMMTTPALQMGKFAKLEYDNAKQIQANRALDPTYLPVIYEAAEKDDPWSEKTWHKANPGLRSGFLSIDTLRQEARDAQRDKTRVHSFKVLRLAQWSEAGYGYLDMTAWTEGAVDFFSEDGTKMLVDLRNMNCFAGLDMAGTTDLASLALLFWDEEEDLAYVLWRHWSTDAMSARLNEHTSGRWNLWVDDESVSLRLFPGDWIDADGLAEEVIELAQTYHPISIGIDSYRGKKMHQLLGIDAGLQVDQLSQTGRAMQAATERVREMVSKRRLFHNGDPVARWCASNCDMKLDAMGFPKIIKRDLDANVRIDAIAALLMAMDRRLKWERDGDTNYVKIWTADDFGPLEADEDEGRPKSKIKVGSLQ